MDILNLVDKLEELFSQGRSVPLTHNVIVDEDRMLDIIDQMRISIPDEVKRSQQVLAQRDRILAQAKEEHDRTIEIAKEKREQLTSSNEVTAEAKKRADQIISQAYTEAEVIKREADKYALDTLKRLEFEMDRTINQVRNGIRTLQRDQDSELTEN
jgi:F0F1-type ATP synthase membrane subunit b/b'